MKARYYCISCSKLVEEEFGNFIVTLNQTGPSYAGGGDPEEQDFVCWDCLDREAADEAVRVFRTGMNNSVFICMNLLAFG